jgi:hypothetical protein
MSEQPDRSASTPPDAPERTAPEPTAAGPAPEPTATPPAEPPRPARLSRRTTVLAGLVAAGALAGTTRTTWVQASAPDLAGTAQEVAVTGADAAPAVLALALAALAAALATSLSSRWVRFLTGPVLIAAGLGAGLAALGPLREPVEAAGSAVAESTGVVGASMRAPIPPRTPPPPGTPSPAAKTRASRTRTTRASTTTSTPRRTSPPPRPATTPRDGADPTADHGAAHPADDALGRGHDMAQWPRPGP